LLFCVSGVGLVLERTARCPVVNDDRQSGRVAALEDVQGAAVRSSHLVLHSDVSYQVESARCR
jgi:hypothetical protein